METLLKREVAEPRATEVVVMDMTLAIISITCCVVGVPANLFSLHYFVKKTRDLPTCLYIVIATTDVITCVLVLPVGICLAANRAPVLFGNSVFCGVWGICWEFIPYFSVFLVLVLSFMRTFSLVAPMKRVKKKVVIGVVAGYGVFLMTRQLFGVVAGFSHYQFDTDAGYCWNHISDQHYQKSDVVFSCLQLAFPIIPISLSCIISTCVIGSSISVSRHCGSANKMKRQATVTIILITLVYILFNLPVFLNYTRYIIAVYWTGKDFLDGSNSNWFMQKYIWIFTYVITVTLNSLLNPVVYLCRMTRFRGSLLTTLGVSNPSRSVRNIHSHTDNTQHVSAIANHSNNNNNNNDNNNNNNNNNNVVLVNKHIDCLIIHNTAAVNSPDRV